jgi:DNA-binding response OmpR family regulator
MSRILVIEDDVSILRGLTDALRRESYDVITAADGETGYQLLSEKGPDLVILDLMLPKMSGYEVCRQVRAARVSVPILMLTARGDEGDRVLGLDLGADDYVTKPFSLRELLARIRALLRRGQPAQGLIDELRLREIAVDFRKYEATRGGRPLDLTRREFQLLRALASRPGEVITRSDLLDQVWGLDEYPTTRTVDTHIASLRAKIERDTANPEHLLTLRGVGYKWIS